MEKRNLLFLQGGGVVPEQYAPLFEHLEDVYTIKYYHYPVVHSDLVTEYRDFLQQKLSADSFKPEIIVAHSLGSLAVDLAEEYLNTVTRVVLVSPLLSRVDQRKILFAIKAAFLSGTPPNGLLWKWLQNIPVFLSQLNHLDSLGWHSERTFNIPTTIFITEKDKLIPQQLQEQELKRFTHLNKIYIPSGHGWILKGGQQIAEHLDDLED